MSPICLLALSLKRTSVRDLLPSSPPKLFLSSSLTNFVLLNTTGSFHYLYFLVFQQHLTEMFIPSLKFFLPITSRTPHSGGFLLYQAASLLLYFVSSESMNPNFGGSKAQHLDLCCFLASSSTWWSYLTFLLCVSTHWQGPNLYLSLDLFCISWCLSDNSTWISIWYVTLNISKLESWYFPQSCFFTFSVVTINIIAILPFQLLRPKTLASSLTPPFLSYSDTNCQQSLLSLSSKCMQSLTSSHLLGGSHSQPSCPDYCNRVFIDSLSSALGFLHSVLNKEVKVIICSST